MYLNVSIYRPDQYAYFNPGSYSERGYYVTVANKSYWQTVYRHISAISFSNIYQQNAWQWLKKVLCAAAVCNKRHKKSGVLSFFFSFPINPQTKKERTHYCKRLDFLQSTNHRLCSAHFSNACYDCEPDVMIFLGCPMMRLKLLSDAWHSIDPTNNSWAKTFTS